MEILNVIEGSEIVINIGITEVLFLVIFLAIGLSLLLVGLLTEDKIATNTGFVVLLFVIILACSYLPEGGRSTGKYHPNQYEVIITDPKYVIDATKYKIVDKRDKIIVLEEIK